MQQSNSKQTNKQTNKQANHTFWCQFPTNPQNLWWNPFCLICVLVCVFVLFDDLFVFLPSGGLQQKNCWFVCLFGCLMICLFVYRLLASLLACLVVCLLACCLRVDLRASWLLTYRWKQHVHAGACVFARACVRVCACLCVCEHSWCNLILSNNINNIT